MFHRIEIITVGRRLWNCHIRYTGALDILWLIKMEKRAFLELITTKWQPVSSHMMCVLL